MIDVGIHHELLKQVDQLSLEEQQRVLEFIGNLTNASGTKRRPRHFMDLAGTLDSQSAEEMTRAIEEGCERVDPNDW